MFRKAVNDNAFFKCGIYGQPGTGKTTAATKIAIGLHELCKSKKLPEGCGKVFFADTEHGASWTLPEFEKAGIEVMVSKTRAFDQLVPMIKEAERLKRILIIDSLSHFWKELVDSFLLQRKRNYTIPADWNYLKGPRGTGAFNKAFVASSAHIIWCAREANIFATWQNVDGHQEMGSVGHKARAETDAGHEPDLLMRFYSHQEQHGPNEDRMVLSCSVQKDRSKENMGKVFDLAQSSAKGMLEINDVWSTVALPHVNWLSLGGEQSAVDQGASWIPPADNAAAVERETVLAEIQDLLVKFVPGRTAAEKQLKGDLVEKYFGVRSWKRVCQSISLQALTRGRDDLFMEMENKAYSLPEELQEELGMTTADKIPAPKKKRARKKKAVKK